jgi:hypothetical protein
MFSRILLSCSLLILLAGCASDNTETTVVRTETTTTVVRDDAAPVTPLSNTDQCYLLTHDMPLIQAAPQRHWALVPHRRDVLPDDVYIATLPAGTKVRLVQVKEYQGQGGAEARFTFGRIENGAHAGKLVATDRIGLNYRSSLGDHARAVPCVP